jgi:amino acid transporter
MARGPRPPAPGSRPPATPVGPRRPGEAAPPIAPLFFLGFAVISFAPLSLAALNVPGAIAGTGASGSAGLVVVIATAVFAIPMLIWLRYSRHINGSGGLYDFVKAAAGPRVALVQAAIWTISYLLYIVYTTEQIVYEVLPAVFPGVSSLQTSLALLIPVAVCAVMVGGRRITMMAAGLLAVSQLAVAGILDGVTLANINTPASSFGAGAPAGQLAKASFMTSLLYICGSLPLFLGGELARPAMTIRRGLTGIYLLTAAVILLAVAPLVAAPELMGTAIPGVAVMQRFAGTGLARAVGVGLALSIGGVILAEFFALTRLVHAVTSWALRPVTLAIAGFVLVAAPLMLINPTDLYDQLLKPSLVALWVSQLIVFVVYPMFAVKHGHRLLPACVLSAGASGLAIYGLVTTLQQVTS